MHCISNMVGFQPNTHHTSHTARDLPRPILSIALGMLHISDRGEFLVASISISSQPHAAVETSQCESAKQGADTRSRRVSNTEMAVAWCRPIFKEIRPYWASIPRHPLLLFTTLTSLIQTYRQVSTYTKEVVKSPCLAAIIRLCGKLVFAIFRNVDVASVPGCEVISESQTPESIPGIHLDVRA